MIVGMEAKSFLGDQFESEQKLRPIGEEQIHIRSGKFHGQIGVFEVRVRLVSRLNGEFEIEACAGNHLVEKPLDPGAGFFHRKLWIQARFLPSFGIIFCDDFGAGAATSGTAVLLKNHCCAMPTTFEVNQYITNPDIAK